MRNREEEEDEIYLLAHYTATIHTTKIYERSSISPSKKQVEVYNTHLKI